MTHGVLPSENRALAHAAGADSTVGRHVTVIALAWTGVQLWAASPLPLAAGVFVLGDAGLRSLHLAFALLLTFLILPAWGRPGGYRLRPVDLALATVAALCAGYLQLFYARISAHPGDPGTLDLAVALTGLLLLLEAARRLLGLPMVLLALAMLVYLFLGPHAPELIAHKGASVAKAMEHLWLGTEGVFGVALGVSAGFIFLFVFFGALLESAGGGSYFVRSALALVGHLRGGPAKAAVGVSAASGLFSGSSITNVVTTGPLTIPLIKRIGYPPEKAAAIEVVSSVNGQVMPPVMGAAAFLMVEYVGIPYLDVLKHALISALVAYLGLLYIVHLEAVKAGLRGLPRLQPRRWQRSVLRFVAGFAGVAAVLLGVSAFGALGRMLLPSAAAWLTALALALAYVLLLRLGARQPLPDEAPDAPLTRMPAAGPTLKSGLHFLLPVGVLAWNLVIARLSPTAAVFWAIVFLVFIVLTQRPLHAWFRGEREALALAFARGLQDLVDGAVSGARGMLVVSIATATAGIVFGTVTLTGIGLVMTELVEVLSGGNVILMLVLVALICLVLGLGLPTTANYIVVSSLMAPVIVTVGAQNGLAVPLIAAHLFVFYFGLLADVLPPGGLASYAAASIAGANPFRTGYIAFRYSMRMALLPLMFVLNPKLLMIGVEGVAHTLLIIASAALAGFVFIAFNQAWLLVRTTRWERLALLGAALILFHPGLLLDPILPPFRALEGAAAQAAIAEAPRDAHLRVVVEGRRLEGEVVERVVLLPLGEPRAAAVSRLAASGIDAVVDEAGIALRAVAFGSPAAKLGVEAGFRLQAVEVAADRIATEWMFLPALGLIGWVLRRQLRRRDAARATVAQG